MARYLDCIKNYRNALVNQIKTANIDGIGDAVFPFRVQKSFPEERSYVVVDYDRADFSVLNIAPKSYMMRASVKIGIYTRGYLTGESENPSFSTVAALADYLDNLVQAVLEVVEPCNKRVGPFSGTVKNCDLAGIQYGVSDDSEATRAGALITLSVSGEVEIPLSNNLETFTRATSTIRADEGDGNVQEFETEIPQEE